MDVEDDEFTRERQERNEHHDPRLYDALMPGHDIPQRVIELERDQQGHDLAEDGLEYFVVERIDRAPQQPGHHPHAKTVERDEHDERDDQCQN